MPAPRNNPTPAPDPAAAAPAETASASLPPRKTPKTAPKPRPRSTYASLNVLPPILYPELPGVASYNGEMPKSPQYESGSQAPVSPNAFSYAPGLSFRQKPSSSGPSAPPLSSLTSPQDLNAMSSSASLPPNYRSSPYPHGMAW